MPRTATTYQSKFSGPRKRTVSSSFTSCRWPVGCRFSTWACALCPVSSEITMEKNRSRSCFVRGLSGCVADRSAYIGVSKVGGGADHCTGLRQQVGQEIKGEGMDVLHETDGGFFSPPKVRNSSQLTCEAA